MVVVMVVLMVIMVVVTGVLVLEGVNMFAP